MNFVYPYFLFALFAILVPIIIHLFNLRKYKKIFFSNVQFLKEIQEEKKGKEKLKHLLILASRILSLLFLVLAFAQPYFKNKDKIIPSAKNVISIYIDNSQSMNAQSSEGNLLEEAKLQAKEIVNHYGLNDQFNLINNHFDGQDQQFLNKEEIIEKINELKISNQFKLFSQVIRRQESIFKEKGILNKYSFLISDFQKSNFKEEKIELDSSINYTLLPIQNNKITNISIDTCYFTKPLHRANTNEELVIKLRNHSENEAVGIPVKLFLNNTLRAISNVSIKPNSTILDTIKYSNLEVEWNKGRIEIVDNPIIFDNQYYFSYKLLEKINVFIIDDKNSKNNIEAVFKADPFIQTEINTINKIDFNKFKKANLIVLNQPENLSTGIIAELKKFLDNSGSVFLIPSLKGNIVEYNNFQNGIGADIYMGLQVQSLKVGKINFENNLLENVFEKKENNLELPSVNSYFIISKKTKANKVTLFELENGDPFLNTYKIKNGYEYLLCSDLIEDNNNFVQQSLFVPIVYNMALNSVKFHKLAYTIGENEIIKLEEKEYVNEGVFQLKNGTDEFILGSNGKNSVYAPEGIKEAGNYDLLNNLHLEGAISFNYSRKESDPELYNEENIRKILPQKNIDLKENRQSAQQNSFFEEKSNFKLWKLCILMVLLFLGIEMLLIRYFDKINR